MKSLSGGHQNSAMLCSVDVLAADNKFSEDKTVPWFTLQSFPQIEIDFCHHAPG